MEYSALRVALMLLPFLIMAVAWVVTNPRENEVAFLSKWPARVVATLGFLLFMSGVAGLPEYLLEASEGKCINLIHGVFGILLFQYGKLGARFRLVEIPR